jgi:predicted dehydrogenase
MKDRLRVLVCGVGNRAFPKDPAGSIFRGWVETVRQSPHFELVAAQDVTPENLNRLARAGVLPQERLFKDLKRALTEVASDVALVCPISEAHAAYVLEAIAFGRHALVEKPFVTRLSDGVAVARAAAEKGVTVGVVQNWRTKSVGQALRRAIQGGRVGRVGNIFFRFVRNREHARLPAYLFEERYPLLYAVTVHHLDLFRYILGEDIVTVSGKAFRPPWSRYRSYPGVMLTVQTESGVSISYSGTFSSQGRHAPQEGLVIDCERGTLTNESAWSDPPLLFSSSDAEVPEDLTAEVKGRDVRSQYDLADDTILEDFYQAVVKGCPPLCPVEDNLLTIAALEGAVRACETGEEVRVRDLLVEAGGG